MESENFSSEDVGIEQKPPEYQVNSPLRFFLIGLFISLPLLSGYIGYVYALKEVIGKEGLSKQNGIASYETWQHGSYFGFFYEYPLGWKQVFADTGFGTDVVHSSGSESFTIHHPSRICIVEDTTECWQGEAKILDEKKVLSNYEETESLYEYRIHQLDRDSQFLKSQRILSDKNVSVYISGKEMRIPLIIPSVLGGHSYIELIFKNLQDNEIERILDSAFMLDDHWMLQRKTLDD